MDRRSVSRSRSRGRSRSSSRSRSRSRSRFSRFEGSREPSITKLLDKQQEQVFDIIEEHKEKLDRVIEEKGLNFKSKAIGKQYAFNADVLQKLNKIKKLLKKEKTKKGLSLLRDVIDDLEDKAEDLIIADSSRHGWLTVKELRGDKSLSSKIQDKVEKIDKRLDKLRSQRPYQPNQRSNGSQQFSRRGRQTYSGQMGRQTVQTYRQRGQGPEEALQALSLSKRSGVCNHCKEPGHLYRECPIFWRDVADSRKKAQL